jgi:hypothetical protein
MPRRRDAPQAQSATPERLLSSETDRTGSIVLAEVSNAVFTPYESSLGTLNKNIVSMKIEPPLSIKNVLSGAARDDIFL